MDFIDLEYQHPEKEGVHTVLVEGGTIERKAVAKWKPGKGFELTSGSLAPEEYISKWTP